MPRGQASRTPIAYLFSDNFRGFRNAYVPVTPISFLVGENSTGKTSILTLARMLLSPEFWPLTESHRYQTPLFADLVSAHSEDRSYFRAGLIQENRVAALGGGPVLAYLVTYRADAGIARISMLTYNWGNLAITVKFAKGKVAYGTEESEPMKGVKDVEDRVFPRWVEMHSSGRGLKKTMKTGVMRGMPSELFSSLLFVEGSLAPDKVRQHSLGFQSHVLWNPVVWLAPIRSKPMRTYDAYPLDYSAEGQHIPYVIKRKLDKPAEGRKFLAFIKRVGASTGLFETLSVKKYNAKSATTPFELDVMIGGKPLSVSNVGYGVSQVLPVIVELFTRPKGCWFCLQQPEIHLHPRAQAALGDLFFQLAVEEGKRFLIETHSDYLIDRFRMRYSDADPSKRPGSQILFFERANGGNRYTQLPIASDGSLPLNQPQAYRDFFIKEQIRLLAL